MQAVASVRVRRFPSVFLTRGRGCGPVCVRPSAYDCLHTSTQDQALVHVRSFVRLCLDGSRVRPAQARTRSGVHARHLVDPRCVTRPTKQQRACQISSPRSPPPWQARRFYLSLNRCGKGELLQGDAGEPGRYAAQVGEADGRRDRQADAADQQARLQADRKHHRQRAQHGANTAR
eukprot:6185365-Pleurochrysis_carterae.AAC.3